MGNVSNSTGFSRGLDEVREVYKQPDVIERLRETTAEREKLRGDANVLAYPRAEDLHRCLFEWLERNAGQDTFTIVWGIDPHDPYDPPGDSEWFLDQDFRGDSRLGRDRDTLGDAKTDEEFQRLINLYDCEIRHWDREFGNLLEQLKTRDRYDDSIIAICSDHGEIFGEQSRNFVGRIQGHGGTANEGRIHIPFVLRTPETTETRKSSLVSLVDVAPTLLEVADLEDVDLTTQGTPVHNATVNREAIFVRTQMDSGGLISNAVRTRHYKYIRDVPPAFIWENFRSDPLRVIARQVLFPNVEVYDLTTDSEENHDVSKSNPTQRERLESMLDDWLTRCEGGNVGGDQADIDSETQAQLKSLSYKD